MKFEICGTHEPTTNYSYAYIEAPGIMSAALEYEHQTGGTVKGIRPIDEFPTTDPWGQAPRILTRTPKLYDPEFQTDHWC